MIWEMEKNNRDEDDREEDWRGRGGRGGFEGGRGGRPEGGRGGHGGPGGPGDLLLGRLEGKSENAQIIFVGSVNCLRHRPYLAIGTLMQQKRASILCPSMSDFSSGRYVTQVEEAIVELSQERNSKEFVLIYGCQWIILSTDGDLICKNLKDNYGIDVEIHSGDHICSGERD